MLGLIFIYFVGKAFYTLAEKHKQNKWLFAILGVISYYLSMVLFGVLLGILNILLSLGFDEFTDTALGVMAIPFGILGCWGFYKILEHKWKKMIQVEIESIDEIGMNRNQE